MFHYNYDPEIFFAIVFLLVVMLLLLFFGVTMRAFYSADKGLKSEEFRQQRDGANILCKLRRSKILFIFFYKLNDGVSREIYSAAIRNYIYCLVAVSSIIAYAIFKTRLAFTVSGLLIIGELFFVPIYLIVKKVIGKKQE